MNDPEALVTIADRFMSHVSPEPNSGCWLWMGADAGNGYGAFCEGGKVEGAHRVSYRLHCGPIPDGLVIDHLCRVPFCVNPQHLEPVSHGENSRRGIVGWHQRVKTHCPSGHGYTKENTLLYRGRRYCRACRRERDALKIRRAA